MEIYVLCLIFYPWIRKSNWNWKYPTFTWSHSIRLSESLHDNIYFHLFKKVWIILHTLQTFTETHKNVFWFIRDLIPSLDRRQIEKKPSERWTYWNTAIQTIQLSIVERYQLWQDNIPHITYDFKAVSRDHLNSVSIMARGFLNILFY